jgi:transcriptional regulator with XRE-family HTH domain
MSALGRTQQELAQRCAVDLRTVQRWLAGQRVSIEDAERVAADLGMGTAELFHGVPADVEGVPSHVRSVLRLLSARDGDFAQGLRLAFETYEDLSLDVSFSSHPARGYVWRFPLGSELHHGFVPFRARLSQRNCMLTVRAQIGRRFGYTLGRAWVRDGRVAMLETFSTRSMLAELSEDGELDLFVWGSGDRRELFIICDQPANVEQLPDTIDATLDLTAPRMRHALCFRPGNVHLRTAGLPYGFDRVIGPREGRMDVPIER